MSEDKAEYYVSKMPKAVRGLDYLRKRILNWFTGLTAEGRCYCIGVVLFIAAAIVAPFKRPEAGFLAQVGAFVFALGLLPLIERLYEWAWGKLLGKLFIAALITLATTVAYGFGRQMVGGLVGTSPEPFTATVNIATILISPLLFLMALAIGGVFIFGFVLCAGMLAVINLLPPGLSSARKRACLCLCRCVAISIAIFGSWALVNRTNGYAGWVSRRAAGYLYTFDMYHDARFTADKNEKIALLGDGQVLIGSRKSDGSGYNFAIRQPQAISELAGTRTDE